MQGGKSLTAMGALLAGALCLPLGACVDTASQVRVEPTAASAKIARRPGVSPRGVSIALASVAGASADINDRFRLAFEQSAGQLELTTVEPGSAEYLVRAYIDASAGEPGVTRLSYAIDLFDRSRKRVARLTDTAALKGAAADPWALADDKALRALAARSASELADALTNTPEAVASSATLTRSAAVAAIPATRSAHSGVARQEPAPTAGRLGLAASR
ncbi:MAG: hypothetical protein ACK5JM_07275 [Rhodoblastus sp.]